MLSKEVQAWGSSLKLQVLRDGGGISCTSSGTLRGRQGSVSSLASTQTEHSGRRKEEEEEAVVEAKPVLPVLVSALTTTVTSTS